ncbi:acyl-CoA dehydrogenase family protein [Nocardioides sp. QY071]|uniref:acyl-CoA dehydrogenase family protein n=1 Tax=Nocardioides sp. QY071 TaxID=3044187 RepID=UPI00249B859B|nr:acyl-CoA dehydrogenase family protein [Nocardioides sp. QY071]WGY00351.1 acyl-CoA dehydrogenase family protein [Nocardioides sp. QY071]
MTLTTHPPAADQLLARLREQVGSPEFGERVVAADQDGRMALGNVDVLRALGITGMPLDRSLGPEGPSVRLMIEVMETLGAVDPSTAVALNMHWVGARTLSRLPSFPRRDEALAAIAAHEATICGAFSNPSAEVDSRRARLSCRIEGDEVVLNGRAGFGSMSEAATYAMLGGMVEDSDPDDPQMVMTVGRLGEPGLVLHRNWSAMGMRGTGSNDIECRDLRIPLADCLVVPISSVQEGRGIDPAIVAFGVTAIWLGLSQAAVDFTVDHVTHRYGYMAEGTFNPTTAAYRADEAWAQLGLGNLDHWVGTGRVLLQAMADRIDAGEDVPAPDLVRTLFHLRRMAEEVALGVMKICGAHGYVTAQPLERMVRDLFGGVVMAWKTDQLQLTLGVGTLGRPIRFTGPAGS